MRIILIGLVLSLSSLALAEPVEIKPLETTEDPSQKKTLGEQARDQMAKSSNLRVPTRRQVHLGFGPAYFNNMNAGNAGLAFSAGYNWIVNDQFELGLLSEFALSTEPVRAYTLGGRIVTNYYFLAQDISPFVGAGFGYGWGRARTGAHVSDSTSSGFSLTAQAGLKFFRTADVNMAISGAYTTIFDQNSIGQPGVLSLQVGLFF